jgi:CRISPR-associated protein Csm4
MKHYIYKLKFLTPVRFGSDKGGAGLVQSSISCHADTLFSALCNSWIDVFGLSGFADFIDAVQNDRVLISDLFPWSGLELYLPKPVLPPLFQRDIDEEEKIDKKAMKKLSFLPVSKFQDYLNFLRTGGEISWKPEESNFAYEVLLHRAHIAREEETRPYLVSAFRFRSKYTSNFPEQQDSGLYFILKASEEWREKFDFVIESLGLSGIGGKRSSGLGKFELAEDSFELGLYDSDCVLDEMLDKEGEIYISLSVLAPNRDELVTIKKGQSFYTLVKRTGFVASPAYADNQLKRKPVVMFNTGSCFQEKIKGRILDVSDQGGHPVYRYGKGMFLGVKI